MLFTDFTEKLLGLQDLKVTKIEKNEKAVCIYAELPRKTHNCICCGRAEKYKLRFATTQKTHSRLPIDSRNAKKEVCIFTKSKNAHFYL